MTLRSTAGKLAAAGMAASTLAMAAGGPAGAADAKPGIGTASVSTTVLSTKLGDLLGLKLLEDTGRSTTDPKVGAAGAVANLVPVSLSSTVAALNKGALQGATVAAPGGPATATTALIDLSDPSSLKNLGLDASALKDLPVPVSALLSGKVLPATLSALATPSSATTLTSKITDLSLLGGLAKVGAVTSSDTTGSGTAAAEATRTTAVDAITVLDLGQLLNGLGIDLLSLPLATVSQLLQTLGVPVDLQGAKDLQSLVTSIQGSIEALTATTSTTVTDTLHTTLTAVDGIGLPVKLAPVVEEPVNTALDALKAQLHDLLTTATTLLAQANVLKVSAVDLSTVARATDAVGTSVADAKATLGSLQVGNTTIPGVDLGATAAQVNALVGAVTGALNTALAPLGIKDVLSIKLFDKATSITQDAGYVKASSAISALTVKVTPPADLAAIIGGLSGAASPISGLLGGTAQAAAVTDPLAGILNGATSLSKGIELAVGTVESSAEHAVPAIVPPQEAVSTPTQLPHTGGESAPFALGALGLGTLALAFRRFGKRAAQ